MALIDIFDFKGEIPRIADNLLPTGYAVTANNCDLDNGNLKPAKGVTSIKDVGATIKTVYKLASNWLQWANYVDVAPALVHDSQGRIAFTGDDYPKETNSALAVLYGEPYPSWDRRLGLPAPDTALTVALGGTPTGDILYSYSYVYTRVKLWSDGSTVESAPSPPTAIYDIQSGHTITLDDFEVPNETTYPGASNNWFRVYRLTNGTNGAEYMFIAEIDTRYTSETWEDTVTEAEAVLNEVLPTTNWTHPDEDLTGILSTSHGICIGFVDNTIYPSEVFIPYAYPDDYTLTTEADIVAMGFTGSTIIIGTETYPYLLMGQDPESLSLEKLPYEQSCVSARSMVSVPGGVIYASPDGLFMVSDGGVGSVLTKDLWTKAQWSALTPANIFAVYYDDAYHAFFEGSTTAIRVDLSAASIRTYTLAAAAYGAHYSSADDKLYLVVTKDAAREIVSWGTGSDSTYTWEKVFSYQSALAFTAGRVIGDFSSGTLTVSIYGDDVLIRSVTLTSNAPFRLPGVLAKEIKIKLYGTVAVERVLLDRSMRGVLNV